MVVLVTGGSGYIGSLLIRRLPYVDEFRGYPIRIFDSMASGKYYSLFDLPPEAKYEFILGDIRKEDDLRTALKDTEVLFDLAGITSVPLSFKKREETLEVNVEGVRRLLDIALRAGVERVIYSSSAAVYGNVSGIVNEDHPCNPTSPYAESKLLAEKLYMEKFREAGLKVTILRLGTVYGYSPGMRFDTVVNRFTFLACIGRPLTVWRGAEECMRPYLYVGDAVSAMILAAKRDEMIGHVYNVVTENAKLERVIGTITSLIPEARVEFIEAPYKQQISYGLDSSRICRLGFKPEGSLERGVGEIIEHLKALIPKR